MEATQVLNPRPIREPVPGAPYQPGDPVTVVDAVDVEIHDVSSHVGRRGRVAYLEYDCGSGQSYPGDPMVGVDLEGGGSEEFWPEELAKEEPCERSASNPSNQR